MIQVLINLTESAYKEMCENGIDNVDYDIRRLMRNGTPLPKGHWIEERTYMECSNCHDIWHYEENQTERFKFCPHCGAKMEGAEE